jgi:hypothetical protein
MPKYSATTQTTEHLCNDVIFLHFQINIHGYRQFSVIILTKQRNRVTTT